MVVRPYKRGLLFLLKKRPRPNKWQRLGSGPALFLRPKDENHSGPRRRIVGATATVSTFVTVVGQPKTPTLAGKGGLRRGLPCLPVDQTRIVQCHAEKRSNTPHTPHI